MKAVRWDRNADVAWNSNAGNIFRALRVRLLPEWKAESDRRLECLPTEQIIYRFTLASVLSCGFPVTVYGDHRVGSRNRGRNNS